MNKDKLVHELFIGKVADAIGGKKTRTLLKEAKEAFGIPVVIRQSEQLCVYCDEPIADAHVDCLRKEINKLTNG